MNTKQLVSLWYGGLVIAVIMLIKAIDSFPSLWLAVPVALITSLFVYTFRPHPQANKGKVLLAVGVPILGIVFFIAFLIIRSG